MARGFPGEPWGVAGMLGAPPEALGEAPEGSLGGSVEVEELKVRILGRFVITWGGPWGAFVGPRGGGTGTTVINNTDQGPSAGGPWPPLSYKLKLIAQTNIGRSEISPWL